MEPRDDYDRAGASLRERAADLARGHDADDVVRLGRRRRGWQGATAGLAVLAVVGVGVAALDQDLVERIEVEPLVPSDDVLSEPGPAATDDTTDAAPLDVTEPARCEPAELETAPGPTTMLGGAATVHPVGIVGAQLFADGDNAYALSISAPVAFAVLDLAEGWRCLPSPPAPPPSDHRVIGTVAGDTVLAVSTVGAASFDPVTERWSDAVMPDVAGADPVAAVWTGEQVVVLFTANGAPTSLVLTFDPATDEWSRGAPLPRSLERDDPSNLLWTGTQLLWVGGELRDRHVWQAAELLAVDQSGGWSELPRPPLSDQDVRAVLLGDDVIVVDGAGDAATFDLGDRTWSEPVATGIDPGSCLPNLLARSEHALLTACAEAASFAGHDARWTPIEVEGSLSAAAVLDDGTALVYHRDDRGDVRLLAWPLDEPWMESATADPGCAGVTDFGDQLADTGITADQAAPSTPAELADDVDLVVAGTLTGEVEVANGPGPAGESYLAYELVVTETIKGDADVGETIRVSIAFDGDPARSADLTRDVPAGAPVAVFAYEVTDAPGGWVAADGDGFAVACEGGAPLGQVGNGPAWSGLAGLDALLDAVR